MGCTHILAVLLWMGIGSTAWSNDNRVIKISCEGQGPSLALARKEALKDCQASAAAQAQTSINIKVLTVQTEKDSALHEEISSNQEVSGLICKYAKEKITELPSSFRVGITCTYDLSKAEFIQVVQEPSSLKYSSETLKKTESRSVERDGGRAISLAVVPECDTIIVKSPSNSRVIKCKNPVRLVLFSDDDELIVRATNHKPKTITTDQLRGANAHYQIFLDP